MPQPTRCSEAVWCCRVHLLWLKIVSIEVTRVGLRRHLCDWDADTIRLCTHYIDDLYHTNHFASIGQESWPLLQGVSDLGRPKLQVSCKILLYGFARFLQDSWSCKCAREMRATSLQDLARILTAFARCVRSWSAWTTRPFCMAGYINLPWPSGTVAIYNYSKHTNMNWIQIYCNKKGLLDYHV